MCQVWRCRVSLNRCVQVHTRTSKISFLNVATPPPDQFRSSATPMGTSASTEWYSMHTVRQCILLRSVYVQGEWGMHSMTLTHISETRRVAYDDPGDTHQSQPGQQPCCVHVDSHTCMHRVCTSCMVAASMCDMRKKPLSSSRCARSLFGTCIDMFHSAAASSARVARSNNSDSRATYRRRKG